MRVVRVPGGSQWPRVYFFGCYSRACSSWVTGFLFPFCCMHSTPSSEPFGDHPHKTMASPRMALVLLRRHCAHAPPWTRLKACTTHSEEHTQPANLQGYLDDDPPRPVTWVHAAGTHTRRAKQRSTCGTRVGSSADRGYDRPWTCCSRCSSEWPRKWAKSGGAELSILMKWRLLVCLHVMKLPVTSQTAFYDKH